VGTGRFGMGDLEKTQSVNDPLLTQPVKTWRGTNPCQHESSDAVTGHGEKTPGRVEKKGGKKRNNTGRRFLPNKKKARGVSLNKALDISRKIEDKRTRGSEVEKEGPQMLIL